MKAHAQVRDELEIPAGSTRTPREIVILAVKARTAVLAARTAVRGAKEPDELVWETLAQNLYAVEAEIADRILPALGDWFGVQGTGGVAPVDLDGQAVQVVRFLGRSLPLERVYALKITFEPETEERLRIVERQAKDVAQFYAARPAANLWPIVALVAVLVLLWRR